MSSPARRPSPVTRGGRRRRASLGTLSLLVPALWVAALAPCAAQARPAGHAPVAFRAAARPLPQAMAARLQQGGFWHRGCPVALSGLRLLTVTHRGFDGRAHTGELIVNQSATGALTSAFRALYERGFPIRHMRFDDFYGLARGRPGDGDVTASFECRQAVPSPCTGGRGTGSWSMHAYGLAVDVNPRENPYVGCGQSRDPAARSYRDRSDRRRGMVGAGAVAAFAAVGWGWGGAWTGNTKDYMHFSSTGH